MVGSEGNDRYYVEMSELPEGRETLLFQFSPQSLGHDRGASGTPVIVPTYSLTAWRGEKGWRLQWAMTAQQPSDTEKAEMEAIARERLKIRDEDRRE